MMTSPNISSWCPTIHSLAQKKQGHSRVVAGLETGQTASHRYKTWTNATQVAIKNKSKIRFDLATWCRDGVHATLDVESSIQKHFHSFPTCIQHSLCGLHENSQILSVSLPICADATHASPKRCDFLHFDISNFALWRRIGFKNPPPDVMPMWSLMMMMIIIIFFYHSEIYDDDVYYHSEKNCSPWIHLLVSHKMKHNSLSKNHRQNLSQLKKNQLSSSVYRSESLMLCSPASRNRGKQRSKSTFASRLSMARKGPKRC